MVSINKYGSWDEVIPSIDDHSKIKHKIYSEYIVAYVKTIMSNYVIPKIEFSIVDGFCGGGVYYDQNNEQYDGSPIVLIEAVNKARIEVNVERINEREVVANYYFIDKDKTAIDMLQKQLDYKKDINFHYSQDVSRSELSNGIFSDLLDATITKIKNTKSSGKALFFLDQYGYSAVKICDIIKILNSMQKSEVILTFNISSMYTYFSDKDEFSRALRNLGIYEEIDWDLYKIIRQDKRQVRRFIQKEISRAIKKAAKAKFMTLFFIKPQNSKDWGYWLIHLTNEYKAHDVMKTLHWNNATYFGHELEHGLFEFGYETAKDIDIVGNSGLLDFEFDFGPQSRSSCVESLHEDFGKFIYTQDSISIEDLFYKSISNTPASEVHLQESIKRLHQEKSVSIQNADGKSRRPSKNYKKSDVITPSKQLILIK